MKNKRHLDKLKRILYKNQELKLKIYKILLYQVNKLNYSNKFNNNFNLSLLNLYSNLNKMGFKTKIKNRCILTGRSFSVDNDTKVSRIMFKKLVDSSNFAGYFKDSW